MAKLESETGSPVGSLTSTKLLDLGLVFHLIKLRKLNKIFNFIFTLKNNFK